MNQKSKTNDPRREPRLRPRGGDAGTRRRDGPIARPGEAGVGRVLSQGAEAGGERTIVPRGLAVAFWVEIGIKKAPEGAS